MRLASGFCPQDMLTSQGVLRFLYMQLSLIDHARWYVLQQPFMAAQGRHPSLVGLSTAAKVESSPQSEMHTASPTKYLVLLSYGMSSTLAMYISHCLGGEIENSHLMQSCRRDRPAEERRTRREWSDMAFLVNHALCGANENQTLFHSANRNHVIHQWSVLTIFLVPCGLKHLYPPDFENRFGPQHESVKIREMSAHDRFLA